MPFTFRLLRIVLLPAACMLFVQQQTHSQGVHFRHINSENGLSNSTIETILQDNRGFLWFGTRDGLNRYDGSQMVVYRNSTTDTNSISDNYITNLYQDKNQVLWVGTVNGLNRLDVRQNRFTTFKHKPTDAGSLSSNHVSAISTDAQGRLLVATTDSGINRYQPETGLFKKIACTQNNQGGEPENNLYTFFEDSRGNLWAGGENGLYLYNARSDAFSAVNFQPAATEKKGVRSIAEDRQGKLLLGMEYAGLIILDAGYGISQQYLHKAADPKSISSNMLRSVCVNKNGEIWVGTVNGGLDKFDGASGSFYNYHHEPDNPNSLSQRTVSVLYKDRQENLWIGTHRGGINVYLPGAEKFKLYRQKPYTNSLSYNDVKTFCEDREGNIWVGTDGGGLNLFNRTLNSFTHFKYDPFNNASIGSNEVLDLTEDSDGNLWIATWGGGLGLYNKRSNNFTRFSSRNATKGQLISDYIQCIFEDNNKQLWIGTYFGGLHLFDRETKTFKPVRKSKTGSTAIIGNNIISITQSKEGHIWIGTDDGGLNKMDAKTGEFEHYFHQDDKKPDIRVLFTDSKDNLWLGQAGLYLYNKAANRFDIFTETDGLATVFIKSIVEDNSGDLWIATSNGLKQLDTKIKKVRTYNTGDGLQDMEFEANANLITRDGQIYFGGINGFNSFYPKNITVNTFVPPVFVTDFQVQNKTIVGGAHALLAEDISFTDQITLNYDEATFSFGFAALNYTASANNQYVYKLKNWDKDWVTAGMEKRASYTNVSAGTYTFTVKAANNDGVWNEKGYSIRVVITPPFWATWWFRLLVVAALVAASLYLYQIRRKIQLQRYEEEKKEAIHQSQLQFFTNISHEFRTPLSLITGPVEKLLKEDAGSKYQHAYQVIQRNANRLLQLINELMDFRKAESGVLKLQVMPGSIPLFIEEIAEAFSELALQKNISFTVAGTTAYQQVWFDRQVLEKITLNLLSNSFKYTQQGGAVTFQVLDTLENFKPQFKNELLIQYNNTTGPFIYFRVSDNGIGISKESIQHLFERYYRVSDAHLGSGIGLAFIKTLTQLHKGNIWVYSECQKGTEMIIAIPVLQAAYTKKEQWMKQVETPLRLESLAAQATLPAPAVIEAPATPTELAGTKEYLVLIADDHEELRCFLKESLEQQYKILEAADGKEAMEKTLEYQPDLIISDIMMPVMDGIAYCKLAKTTMETAHIPFILLTAKNGLESRMEGADTGADYYFSKPLSMDLLLRTIRNIFTQKEKLREHYRNDQHAKVKALAHSSRDKQFVEELLAIIENNLSKPEMDIDFVCTEIGMSRTKLYNKVKSITGQPIGDFIRTIRLRKAADFMIQGDGSLTDIMYSVGIQTQSYFSKAFKQEFGKSPTQYLKDIETKNKG